MKLVSSQEDLAENKILILYLLNKVGKVINNDNLFKLVLSIVDMNYFYFQQFLLDLIQNKYIVSYKKNSELVYEITELGKETLKLTSEFLPGILKLKIDKNLKTELNTIEDEVSVVAEYIPQSENEFLVKCRIIENCDLIFEVQTLAGSREQAKYIVDNWKNNASAIYPKILGLLSK